MIEQRTYLKSSHLHGYLPASKAGVYDIDVCKLYRRDAKVKCLRVATIPYLYCSFACTAANSRLEIGNCHSFLFLICFTLFVELKKTVLNNLVICRVWGLTYPSVISERKESTAAVIGAGLLFWALALYKMFNCMRTWVTFLLKYHT